MFGNLLNLVKDTVMVPVAVATDVANIVTFDAISEGRSESFTETALKKVGEDVENLIEDDVL